LPEEKAVPKKKGRDLGNPAREKKKTFGRSFFSKERGGEV